MQETRRVGSAPGAGNSSPLQDSRLENPTHRGAWRAAELQSGCKESDLTWQLKQTRDSEDSGRLLALLTLSPDVVPEGTGGQDPWGTQFSPNIQLQWECSVFASEGKWGDLWGDPLSARKGEVGESSLVGADGTASEEAGLTGPLVGGGDGGEVEGLGWRRG